MKHYLESIVNYLKNNKFFKNLILIFSGEGLSSVFGFLATIFIVNAIGSYEHGVLVAVQTYTNLFYGLFSFKTFQSLIKYLARSDKEGDYQQSKLYIKWSVLLDVICLCATMFCGVVFKDFVIGLMDWNTEISKYCIFYLLVYMFYFQGTTIGVLRYFEKYQYVVISNVICSIIRCLGFFFSLILNLGFITFFFIDCIGNLTKFVMMDLYTIKTLKEHHLLDFYRVKLTFCSDFLKFSFYSNITSTIDLPVNQITSLIVNKYLGFEATSVYSVFGNIGSVIYRLGDPISQVIYPEMNKLISQNKIKKAKKLSIRLKISMFFLFILCSIFVVFTHGIWLKLLISNPSPYVVPLILYIGFCCYVNSAMGTHNLFMALGYVKFNIPILLIVNSLYLILLTFSVRYYGLTGVILVYLIQAFAVVVVKEVIMYKKRYEEIL